jgi:tRNA uridine 5-carboxymethylaminomethyl modification enzyme
MSCNPAIGGPGKSQLVLELDVFGGAMSKATDASALQLRILNRSKGPAIWATRAQVDRAAYARAVQRQLETTPGLTLIEGEVASVVVEQGRVRGVVLGSGRELQAQSVVLTAGTFLRAMMHLGGETREGGRHGDGASVRLSEELLALGLRMGRFRTGTPPRLLGSSIDFDACIEQPSETDALPFSSSTEPTRFPPLPQRSCFATRTRAATHALVLDNIEESALFRGLKGRGPRYCPALEIKIAQHPHRESHSVYLEPEGISDDVVYPAGLSTSLPAEIQLEVLRTIPGLNAVEVVRPGYAVEYDYLAPGQLRPTLETVAISGLYSAGQVNGSSGYEEAAGQGLVAGVNAARAVMRMPSWVPDPRSSYLGVLCEDLTRRGYDEPYRLLPSRAEARLLLREGNAALRLQTNAAELGLSNAHDTSRIAALRAEIDRTVRALTEKEVRLLRNPALTLETALAEIPLLGAVGATAARELYLDIRYAPYEAQRRLAEKRLDDLAALSIPPDLRYSAVTGLSGEAADVLEQRRPRTVAEARALPGVNGAMMAVLAAHLRRRERMSGS